MPMIHMGKMQSLEIIKEEFENMGYTFYKKRYQYSNSIYIGLSDGDEEIIEMEIGYESDTIRISNRHKNTWDITMLFVEKVIEEFFKKQGDTCVFLEGDKRLWDLGYLNFKTYCAVELQDEKTLTPLVRGVECALDMCKERVPSLSYSLRFMSERKIKIDIKTYYQIRTFECQIKQGELCIDIEGKKTTIEKDQLDAFLKDEINKEDKVQKMKAIFWEKPHPYWNLFLWKNEWGSRSDGKETEISSILSTYYPYEEIERIAKEKLEKKEPVIMYKGKWTFQGLIPFGEIVIYQDKENITIEKDKKEAVKKFQTKVLEDALGEHQLKKIQHI